MLEQIKVPAGRPVEDNTERIDLTEYMLSSKFQKKLNQFYNYWYSVVKKKTSNKHLVSNMENFYGEIIDKFEELPRGKRELILVSEAPFKLISESTNLKLPTVFESKQDNKDFIEIFLTHKF